MFRYSEERKAAVLKRLLPPDNEPVLRVSKEEGISDVTLYHWLKQLKIKGGVVPVSKLMSDKWSPEARLAVVIETAALSEIELGTYCREKGLLVEQVAAWKQAFLDSQLTANKAQKLNDPQSRSDKKRIKELERELNRKEKALAETAALLVLRKKLDALWETDDEVS